MKRRKVWRRRLCSFSTPSVASPTSQLILLIRPIQPFCRFKYVRAHIQPFRCFTYVTANPSVASPTSPGEPPMGQTPLEPNSRYATDDRWTYKATMWDPRTGKRHRGRPRRRWADTFREQAGHQWTRAARRREEWKILGTYI